MKLKSEEDRQPEPASPVPIIFEAIVRQMCVTATYNRGTVILAPHIIYTRHGDLFIDAVTIERDGNPPREPKLGTFKLTGLGDLAITARGFDASELFDPAEERYVGETLVKIEPNALAA